MNVLHKLSTLTTLPQNYAEVWWLRIVTIVLAIVAVGALAIIFSVYLLVSGDATPFEILIGSMIFWMALIGICTVWYQLKVQEIKYQKQLLFRASAPELLVAAAVAIISQLRSKK